MNEITSTEIANNQLENVLTGLLRFGKPMLSYGREGWSCGVEMNTTAEGARFDVRSDFGMKTASEAVNQCRMRILETLKLYKEHP